MSILIDNALIFVAFLSFLLSVIGYRVAKTMSFESFFFKFAPWLLLVGAWDMINYFLNWPSVPRAMMIFVLSWYLGFVVRKFIERRDNRKASKLMSS